ncbi:multifunctional CCA tRNA nucleotidyl transferase/2'3'-cyclic phosphodiesterase/2'nucleotidase/phosphatase, partial [Azotobacter chroococcum]|nr:multifunctional CCA tRNA nucleotidyl transferase/2'3'-cyclic phosphodiesterase/2'nucleotidase/phosphatase [Azotobacter chroococcum]
AVTVQPLLERGLEGAALGEALKRERLRALATYKAEALGEPGDPPETPRP